MFCYHLSAGEQLLHWMALYALYTTGPLTFVCFSYALLKRRLRIRAQGPLIWTG